MQSGLLPACDSGADEGLGSSKLSGRKGLTHLVTDSFCHHELEWDSDPLPHGPASLVFLFDGVLST